MKKIYSTLFLFCLTFTLAMSQVLYTADFGTEGEGFPDHDSSNPPAAGPASASGGVATNDWTVSYDTAPGTDGSANEFSVDGAGKMHIQDWGGTAEFESASIDISGVDEITIDALGMTVGSAVQNASSEFFEYFYIIDGVETVVDIPLSGDSAGDPVNLATGTIDVSSASTLTVGFRFNVNGGGDGYDICSIIVEGVTLPVELTKFNVSKRANKVDLIWQTASEINNDRFEIERSTDANRFESIGEVEGEGNSQRLTDYTFIDERPSNGINYYRLKQVDIDGAFEYSDVVSIELDRTKARITPTTTFDQITVSTGESSNITVRSFAGQFMSSQSSSDGNFTVDMTNYPRGIYFLSININGDVQTEKIVRL